MKSQNINDVSLTFILQQEHKLENQEARLHAKAVNAALHGNIGRAMHLEVTIIYHVIALTIIH